MTFSLPENCVYGLGQGLSQAKYMVAVVFWVHLHKAWTPGVPCRVCTCGLGSPDMKHVCEKASQLPQALLPGIPVGFARASGNHFICDSFQLQRLSDWGNCLKESLGVSICFFLSLLSWSPCLIPTWSEGIGAAVFSWHRELP